MACYCCDFIKIFFIDEGTTNLYDMYCFVCKKKNTEWETEHDCVLMQPCVEPVPLWSWWFTALCNPPKVRHPCCHP